MDKLQAMQVFVRVVETGGITHAADSLRIPKATATTLIQRLEASLGVKLLNRTTRRVSVTPDGAAYYERCVAILAAGEGERGAAHAASLDAARTIASRRADAHRAIGDRARAPAVLREVSRYRSRLVEQ